MRIYLDNNATTPIDPAVLDALGESLRALYGNASSIHREGQAARRALEDAREAVAQLIGATSRELVFTSGGTESNNAAIYGSLSGRGAAHIVSTAVEHPSVTEPLRDLAARGHAVTLVPPSANGAVDPDAIVAALRDDTRLLTMMLANNETGVVQPVAAAAAAARARGIHVHVDAVQAAGKIEVGVEQLQCDTLALSAHKLHAPKGIGALYVRRATVLQPHLVGGAQERRRRAGTENVPLAAAFGVAARLAGDRDRWMDVAARRDRFESALRETALPLTVNGSSAERVPNTSSVTFHGADGEGLVIGLDLEGVAVSTGSACSSGRVEPSPVLLAMGLSPADARATVRFSSSRFTTDEELLRVVQLLSLLVPRCTTVAVASAR
jgi:cysteine desulfurase